MNHRLKRFWGDPDNPRIILFAFLALLVVAFIFSNSLRGQEVSDEQSKTVASLFDPTIDPQGGIDEYERVNAIVRKAAHMTEFALLGAVLYGLLFSVHVKYEKWLVGVMLFGCLAVAVIDETIQYFVPGRVPQVFDVLIDFVGATLGVLFGWLTSTLWKRIDKRKRKRSKRKC